jgi:hypothetical protein
LEAYYALVAKVIVAFESAGLDYAFTGALATSFYGIPRTTSDVDVMVAISNEQAIKSKVTSALRLADLTVDERSIDNALVSGFRIASFKDKNSPFSVDVIFSTGKLDKRAGEISGLRTYLQSPEGLIAAKLRMIKATIPPERSVKDRLDIKAILQFTAVDLSAVKKQAKKDRTLNEFDALGLKA